MKTKLTALLVLACMTLTAQNNKAEILTNETIVTLIQKGLGSGVIINKIKSSKTNFDVSTDALIKLKDDKVPDDVVAVMLEYPGSKDNSATQSNDPLASHDSGIYHESGQNNLVRLDPTVVSSQKSGGFGAAVAQAYTYGLAKSKSTSVISGSNARKQIHDTIPVFYFYFDKSKDNLNNYAAWWFASATSPNEFALVKLKEKKDSREIVTGKSNAYSSSTGISEDQKIPFDYTEVGEGIFKVTPRGNLKQGEYCFMFTGAVPSIHANNKVFDFGIF